MTFAWALPERVLLGDATAVMHALQAGVPPDPLVQLDASALQTFDSSVVAVLLALQRRLAPDYLERGESLFLGGGVSPTDFSAAVQLGADSGGSD